MQSVTDVNESLLFCRIQRSILENCIAVLLLWSTHDALSCRIPPTKALLGCQTNKWWCWSWTLQRKDKIHLWCFSDLLLHTKCAIQFAFPLNVKLIGTNSIWLPVCVLHSRSGYKNRLTLLIYCFLLIQLIYIKLRTYTYIYKINIFCVFLEVIIFKEFCGRPKHSHVHYHLTVYRKTCFKSTL